MLGNRSTNTAPEMRLRRELHRMGLRYRVNTRLLEQFNRRADIVFRPRGSVSSSTDAFGRAS